MINKPPLNELMKYVDSKYTLVIVAAKRARTMIEDNPDMLAKGMINPVSVALREVAEGNVIWKTEDNTVE